MSRCCWGGLCLAVLLTGGTGELSAQKKKPAPRDVQVRGKTVKEWIKALQAKELFKRVEAVNALREAGPDAKPAVKALLAVFLDRDATLLHPLAALALAAIGADVVPDLVTALSDKSPLVRGGATMALGLLGPRARPAVRALSRALADSEAIVRAGAATALREIGSGARPAVPALRKALQDREAAVRVEAADALWQVGGDTKLTIKVLAAALEEETPLARRAADVLGDMGPAAAEAGDALRAALRATDARVQLRAAEALYRVKGDAKSCVAVLAAALKSSDTEVKREAAQVVGVLGGTGEVSDLLTRVFADKDAHLRREAACGLAAARKASATVLKLLRTGLEDPDPGVAWWSAVALIGAGEHPAALVDDLASALHGGEAGSDKVAEVSGSGVQRGVPALAAGLKANPTRLRRESARALALVGSDARAAAPALLELLRDGDKLARRAAADALAQLGPGEVPTLVRGLSNPSAAVREGCARALGQMGVHARPAIASLRKMLKDAEAPVRTQAALALWRLDRQADVAVPILNLVHKDVDNKDRWEAIEAFGIIAVEARPPIRGLTEVLVTALKDREARVRVAAVRALWRRTKQEKVVVPLLREAVTERDVLVRLLAVQTLGELGAEAKVTPLIFTALEDRDAGVRFAAVKALARGGKEIVPQLVPALKDKRAKVRAGVARALGLMGPRAAEARRALLEAAQDKDRSVKEAARKALQRIIPESATGLLELVDMLKKIEKAEKDNRR
jgi:HEAT repeat protein